MAFVKISEQSSLYNDLEKKSVGEILTDINTEDKKVALAVEKAIPQIEKLVNEIVPRMKQGGRIFYMGAGTSGRLGVLDASEIPPTFGMDPSWVIGLIAGGGAAWGDWFQMLWSVGLVVLAVILVIEGIQVLTKKKEQKAA